MLSGVFFEIVERVFDRFIESVDSDIDALGGMRALLTGRRWSVSDLVRFYCLAWGWRSI